MQLLPTRRLAVAVALFASLLCVEARAETADFAGTFSGPYTFSSSNPNFGNQQGVLTLSIKPAGLVSGRIVNTSLGAEATGTGSVDDDGGFRFTAEFSNQVYTLKGIIVHTKSDSLKGTLTQFDGSNQAVGSVDFNLPATK